VKAGDLVKFDYVNGHTRSVNNKVGIYLGDRPIHRDDGAIIDNFEVHLLGEDVPRLCDGRMKRWLKVVEA